MRARERSTKDGNFLILFAVSSGVIMGMGAISLDLSYLRNCRMQLQNAVDAAAHAALISYRTTANETTARQVAKDIAALNFVGGRPVSLGDTDIVFGTWDFTNHEFSTAGSFVNAVSVVANRRDGALDGPIQLFIAPVIGIDSGEAAAEATGAFRFRELELLLDTTGSFFRDIDNGRNAVISFLDKIYTNHLPQDKIGLVAFAQQGKEFTPLQDVVSNYAAIRASWYGQGDVTYNCRTSGSRRTCSYYDPTSTYGLNLCFQDREPNGVADTTNPNGVTNVAAMKQQYFDYARTITNVNCFDGSAYNPRQEGTDHSTALQKGIDVLLNDGVNGNMKVIVMVSDGRAQCKQPDDASSASCVTSRQILAQQQTARAAENNISIFSVMFCSNCSSASLASYQAYADTLVTGVGKSYTTTDSNQLDDILNEIADSLPVALVQ